MKKKAADFIKAQPVLFISALLALLSMLAVPPNKSYIKYINFSTVILLFSLMGAVCGFRKCGIFDRMSDSIKRKSVSLRLPVFLLINICFFSSMFITNDVALITFVPVTLMLFSDMKSHSGFPLIFTIVLETAAANLGSMLLPTGNPQNIFLCSRFGISPAVLIKTLLPFGIVSYIILSVSVFLLPKIKPTSTSKEKSDKAVISKRTAVLCSMIFIISMLTVSGIINEYICLISAVILILLSDADIFRRIDYALLLTFVCFFIFTGNLGKIDAVKNLIADIIIGKELIVSVLTSQIFSNVPAAILLSGFTDKADLLLIGTNIGGLGTPIASLASLISFNIYSSFENSKPGKYMIVFLIFNLFLLVILLITAFIIRSSI